MKETERVLVASTGELRDWLVKHHQEVDSIWLVKWKKESGGPYFSYDEMVDELLCFGWIDSLPRSLDEQKTMIRISPRNPKSNWSKINKDRIERLIKADKMEEPGMKAVVTSKKNGTWDFLTDVENLIIPSDLEEALAKNQVADYYFERFPKSSKRGILEWIKNAKQDTTRKKRIDETVAKASKNLKANHPKGRDQGPHDVT